MGSATITLGKDPLESLFQEPEFFSAGSAASHGCCANHLHKDQGSRWGCSIIHSRRMAFGLTKIDCNNLFIEKTLYKKGYFWHKDKMIIIKKKKSGKIGAKLFGI